MKRILPVLAVATAYVATAKIGFTMGVAKQVTLVWPPTGIALAAVLLLGRRGWMAVALGAFVANVTAADETIATACGVAIGNTLEAVIGAWALARVGFRTDLGRLRDVLALVVLAVLASTAVSATIGVTTLCLGGVHTWAEFGSLWREWWMGDAIGDLVVAPVLLVLAARPAVPPHRLAEAGGLLVAVALASFAIFATGAELGWTGYPRYAIFPFVIWAALRFGQLGTTAVTVVASSIAIWSTMSGRGPMGLATPHETLLLLQLFMSVVAVTALFLGAAITERDAAVRGAAADNARLRLALDAGRMGVWDWNVLTGRVTWTENLEPIHGLPAGAFPGTFEGFLSLVHPDDRDAVQGAITRALDDGTGYDIEFRNLRPDGTVGWISAKGTVLRDAVGRAVRMIGVGMEVTEHRRLAEALRAHAAQLADADRRKDEFLAMLAHELRNPLAPLSTALHLLGSGTADAERYLQMANRQVRHLVRLVDDLLDVSRITRGKIVLRKEAVALDRLVAQAIEIVRPLVDSRGHNLTVSLPAEPVRLEADPARIAQVLANLLTNAVKYTPPGGAIWLTAEPVDGRVVVRVRDTGAGLDPALLPNVFDLFVQGDAARARTQGGLGIGLTIVRRLVELHGGRVEAHSEGPGRGSEFVIELPALAPRIAADAEAAAPPAERAAAAALRVLLVEDNRDAADSLAMLLRLWGHEVHVAFEATTALELANHHQPHVILSDIGLPGIDGYELARRLRRSPGFGGAVLVALTGYGRDDDRRQAVGAGFDHHLTKPPDLDSLAQLLGRVAAAAVDEQSRTLH